MTAADLIVSAFCLIAIVGIVLDRGARRKAPTLAQRRLANHVDGPTAKVLPFPDPKARVQFKSTRRM